MRINVDFPQPDGPIRAVTVPVKKSRVTLLSAWCLPNHACTPRASRPEPIGLEPTFFSPRALATAESEFVLTPWSAFIFGSLSVPLLVEFSSLTVIILLPWSLNQPLVQS